MTKQAEIGLKLIFLSKMKGKIVFEGNEMRIRSSDVPGPARETRHCFCGRVIGDHNSLDVVSNCGKKSSGKLDVVIDSAGLLLPSHCSHWPSCSHPPGHCTMGIFGDA